MEAPEGFRNSDEDRFSESQVIKVDFFLKLSCECVYVRVNRMNLFFSFFKKESSVEDVQDLCQMEMPEDKEEERGEEKGDEQLGERSL